MSKYTQSIYSILEQYAQDGEDITKLSDIYTIGIRDIFGEELNVISEEYRQHFVTSFILHFFEFEIGRETLPLWKMALKARVYENGSYINQIYGLMDKNLFADYRVTKTNAEGTSQNNTTNSREGSTTVSGTNSSTTANTGSSNDTGNNVTTNDLSTVVTGKGTVENAKSGANTTADTGSIINAKSGDNVTKDTGTDSTVRTGTDTDKHTGNVTVESSGEDVLTKAGSETNRHDYASENGDNTTTSHASHTKHVSDMKYRENGSYTDTTQEASNSTNNVNKLAVQNDTPMGSLSNMRTPNTSSSGTGVSGVDGYTYKYASFAQTDDETSVDNNTSSGSTTRTYDNYYKSDDGTTEDMTTGGDSENYDKVVGSRTKSGHDDDTLSFTDRTDTTAHTNTDTTEYNEQNQKTVNLTDATTHDTQSKVTFGETNTQTNDTESVVTFGEKNTQTNDTTDTTKQTGDVTVNSTNANTHTDNTTVEAENASNTSVTDNVTGTATGSTTNDSMTEDYSLNYEMIMKSESYMSKIYECFNDLFLWIF